MQPLTALSTLFLLFTVYSFIGWFCESIYCSVPAKKFINRGFLNGPFCPVYGVGGVLVVTLLTPFQDNLPLLYLMGVLVTSLVEYITGFLLEKIFHTTWWDYSNHRFNLHGRVCLLNSLLFGAMALLGMKLLHPAVLRLLHAVPEHLLPFLAGGFLLYFACDTFFSVRTVLQLNGKLAELQRILDEAKEKSAGMLDQKRQELDERVGEGRRALENGLQALRDRQEQLEQDTRLALRRMLSAFPHMRSLRSNESLLRVRAALEERRLALRRQRKQKKSEK